jgi:hypothetical protein
MKWFVWHQYSAGPQHMMVMQIKFQGHLTQLLLFRSRILPSEYMGGLIFHLFDKIGATQQTAGPFMTA